MLDVSSCNAADCDTGHYLVGTKNKKRLAVNKKNHIDFIWKSSKSRI
jgi:hypothetical protein